MTRTSNAKLCSDFHVIVSHSTTFVNFTDWEGLWPSFSSPCFLSRGRGIREPAGLRVGSDLVLDLAGGHFFEENWLECFRVVHALGGVENFDTGEMVEGIVVEGDAVIEVFGDYGGVCEADV